MTIHFGQGKLEEDERQAILEEVYQRAKGAATAAVKAVVEALLEAEVTAKLGREKGAVRHISGQPREVDWVCGQCGCCDAQHFTRDGHYRRSLQTGWGSIQALRVPMLECQQCGHDVLCHFTILEKYERFWLDLDQDVVLGSALGESLRHLCERWGEAVGSSIGLRTLVLPHQPDYAFALASPPRSHYASAGGDPIRWYLAAAPSADGHPENRSSRATATATQG